MRNFLYLLAVIPVLGTLAMCHLWPADDALPPAPASPLTAARLVARGAELARAGDCQACHTVRGGAPYAGGRTIATPFGALLSPNISADRVTGIGAWSADDFWRALHNGKSRDGRLLYPAFPYPDYTKVTRADANALYAYLQSLPALSRVNQPHRLAFPYNQQIALAIWRALYFRPAAFAPQASRSAQWNRGAYLVQGLGHCAACHSRRNFLGATDGSLAGGVMPGSSWYAPSLTGDARAGLGGRNTEHLVQLLKTGVAPHAAVFGPMADVVQQSLQYMAEADVRAMVVYLQSLPAEVRPDADRAAVTPAVMSAGARLYEQHCMECHRVDGKGLPPAYPGLAGNRALTMRVAVNPIRMVLNGGFAPGTAGNPRPYGMAPYGRLLSDTEVAALVTYLRNSWGNHGGPVSASQVNRYRGVPLD